MRYFDLLRVVNTHGAVISPRDKETKELLAQPLFLDGYNAISTDKARSWDSIKAYLYPELAWYMSGDRNVKNILPYSKFWETIRNPDMTANSNYGDLVFYRKNSKGITSYTWALNALLCDRNTRKGIVLYNDRELFYLDNKDLICNQYQQFLIRDNKLICLVALRSSDMVYGLTFNMPWWSLVHQILYLDLKEFYPELELGGITAFLGSVHIYDNKYQLVNDMLLDNQNYHFLKLYEQLPMRKKFEEYMELIPNVYR